jgi:hypothetical protein
VSFYPKPEHEELLRRAQKCVDRQSKSYVEDAMVFARVILEDYVQTLENLTNVQTRCSDLLEENRLLRKKLGEHPTPLNDR